MIRKPWADRGSRHERGYGAAWVKTRARIMRRDRGLCQECLKKGRPTRAMEVDHIIAKANGGTDDDGNLQALCQSCHSRKTAIDKGERVRPRIGTDGWPVE